jgi:hypothetical protein
MNDLPPPDLDPMLIAKKMLRGILDEHAVVGKFPKDCLCADHKGPHVAHLSRQQAVKNYAHLFEVLRTANIPEGMFPVIRQILAFSETERHRQSIFIKDLKFLAADLYPELLKRKTAT